MEVTSVLPRSQSALLTLEQFAERLSITRAQAYELTRTRSRCRQVVQVPVIKIGKRRYIREAALNEWLQALEEAQAAR